MHQVDQHLLAGLRRLIADLRDSYKGAEGEELEMESRMTEEVEDTEAYGAKQRASVYAAVAKDMDGLLAAIPTQVVRCQSCDWVGDWNSTGVRKSDMGGVDRRAVCPNCGAAGNFITVSPGGKSTQPLFSPTSEINPEKRKA